MIHITKAKGGYMVVITGKKHEVLSTSEILKTKHSAFKNVWAHRWFFKPDAIYTVVQDDTGEKPVCYMVQKVGNKLIKTFMENDFAQDLFTVKIRKYKQLFNRTGLRLPG